MAAALVTTRRFPPPWSVDEYNDACFIVRDHNGQQLAYVYFEDEPGRRSAAKLLSKDEARRIAVNIAKLPERLWQRPLLCWKAKYGGLEVPEAATVSTTGAIIVAIPFVRGQNGQRLATSIVRMRPSAWTVSTRIG